MAKYYYCIANSSTSISSSVISSSTALEFSETTRTIHFNCDNQYAYFVVDKSLGEFSFQVNIFKGGFEDPTEITVNDVVYRSYRSTQKLKGSIDIELINVNVATEYLETQWELRPKTDFALVQAEYIGYNGQRMDRIIRDWQTVYNSIEAITEQNSRSITANTASITANTTAIAANTAKINTNTANIATNTSDINALKSKVETLEGGIKLKGRVDSVSLLPATAEIGDLYLVGLTTDTDLAEYLYTSAGHWELLGKVGDIDLSEYAKKTDIPTVPTKVSAFTNDAGYLTEEQYKGTYSKPSGGIPKSDLASAVQTSLGKADTALQSYTEKYTGTYSKPSGGIPKTDLASAVQTSLGLADTALQSYTEKYTGTYSKPSGGIPKTDLASAVQTSLGLADTALQSYTEKYTGTYSKPSGGIPKTDLASAVQTSLGLADTALQSHQDISGKLDKSGGTMTGNLVMGDGYKSVLMRANASWRSGIGYDTKGNEALSLWATNSVTRLRWYAGKDMSAMSTGTMMDITPDFEISKADGSAKGYIAGSQIAVKSDIPSKVSQLTNDSGYTTNSGTVTSVAVKMNGSTKGTVTSSGTIDLGTVITSHQSLSNYVTTSDSRLTDSRNAKDVYSWAKASTKPTYTADEVGAIAASIFNNFALQGPRNLFSIDNCYEKRCTIVSNSDGSIKLTSGGAWQYSNSYVYGLIPGVPYRLIVDTVSSSTNSFYGAVKSKSGTLYGTTGSITSAGRKIVEFTPTESTAIVSLNVNNSGTSSTTASITFFVNLKMRDVGDASFTEYAPTNAELYRMIKELKGGN